LTAPVVSVTIVTFNGAEHIVRCLDSVFSQEYAPLEVIVVDNGSSDDSPRLLRESNHPIRAIFNPDNRGFCAAQNQAIAAAQGEWVLCLNPDTKLHPQLIAELVKAGGMHERIGIVCPKILRLNPDAPDQPAHLFDSAGMYITPQLRHHDRGSQQPDEGQYDQPELVFGYTGAIVLFRRTMISDVSIHGQFMDEDFHFYREDADLSWRAQLMGWNCLYWPAAVGFHIRRVFEHNRAALPSVINMHSTKNRFLMRINNMTPGVYRRVFWPATLRDLGVIAYVLLRERSSLPGLVFLWRERRRLWRKRAAVQQKRCVPDAEIATWFSSQAVSRPLEALKG
jgi:GT2 family glycosyltransferase